MTKAKPYAAQQAAELRSIEMCPKAEGERRTEVLLHTLLSTPPTPHTPKAKPKKRAKK